MLTALSRAFSRDSRSPFAFLFGTEALRSPAAGPAIITRKAARERAALAQQLQDPLRVGCGMAMDLVPGAPVMRGVGTARMMQVDGVATPAFSVSGGTGDFLALPEDGDGLTLCRLGPGRQPGEPLAFVSEAQVSEVIDRLEAYRADVALQLFLIRTGQGGTMPGLVVLGAADAEDAAAGLRVRVLGRRTDRIATLHAGGAELRDLGGTLVDSVSREDVVAHAEALSLV